MLKGTGSLILGDFNFASEIAPLCINSFELTQELTTYGYNYINSSKKLIVPNVDSFETKNKIWSINMEFGVLETPVFEMLRGFDYRERSESTYSTFTSIAGNVQPIDLINIVEVFVFNITNNAPMTQVMGVPSSNLEYNFDGINFTFFDNTDVVEVLVFGGIQNFRYREAQASSVLSFTGIVYTLTNETMMVYAPEVQIISMPQLSLSGQVVTLEALKELKIYKVEL